MQTLIDKAFARLENRNSQASTFLLAQAMGSGKTHSMIALGLLAKYPALRRKILVETYTDEKSQEKKRKHYCSVTEADLDRESKVLHLLDRHFHDWQEK